MSQSSYGQMWATAQGALENLLEDEYPTMQLRPQKDRLQVFQTLASFYLRYLKIFRSLEEVYDQIFHPQKRRVVHHVLEGVMGRLVELKNEMVELEYSEFQYFDDILQDFKMTPEDLEVPIPRYFVRERMRALKEREKMLAHILTSGGHQEHKTQVTVQSMSMERAVWLLQVSERARQGRLRAHFMKKIHQEEQRRQNGESSNMLDPDLAATCIQKVWRGYRDRKKVNKERLEEMIFLGMIPAQQMSPNPAHLRAQQVKDSRHRVQEEHENEYQKALVDIKESVETVDGPNMKETLQEQIRQWFIECRDATGKFPDFPSAEDGGSASIFAQKTPEQVAAELAAKEAEREKKKKSKGEKDKKGNDRKEKKKGKKGKMKGKKGKGEIEEEEQGWKMTPSNFLPTVVEGTKLYKEVWHNRDEKQNFLQRFDAQLVREEKRLEVEEELRVQVDELMRQELKNLKLVVDRDKGKKKKKGKKSSKKKKKKGRKTGKKKKKEKDLTADRTIESLYKELVLEGIIIRPMNVKLSDYIGEYSYLGTTLRQADIEPMPSLSDIRQLIALYGVLPLGSQSVHERGPLIRSVLLAGPAGVGKKMLVHALCTETGANLFNLSATTLAGKYPGKSGLQYLLHVVFKVARQLQPSVIWIGDAEKTFYKKVPKLEKEMEPKRLKKTLPKVLKSIKPEDRVLVVGTTRRPFDADIKPFCKVYKKIILIPRPDYASRLTLWKELLLARGAQLGPKLDLSSLAKVTDGYTQSHILQAIQTVLSSHRLDQQTKRPLTAVEFIPPLARQDPVYKEEEETFKAWYSRSPLGKKRARAARASEEEADLKKGKKKVGKIQKKGKDGKSKMKKKKK
ncbi:dynein regulatory complex protein 11 isoform X1 [Triplophysa dalaica]|uniref:dynein regulatory complex protein 11 isoform X1 n=1 Tax=Triplophysa dalaica TaxID=1582913 RepID=UPI0024E0149E|nr:dynein regulatory complex protein 11 isoform X1 [Triplophysa dalaica]